MSTVCASVCVYVCVCLLEMTLAHLYFVRLLPKVAKMFRQRCPIDCCASIFLDFQFDLHAKAKPANACNSLERERER